jgi:large subunit ribosomal protein L24
VQMMKKHVRPNPARQIKGGIAERETPIAVSNVMVLCGQCGATRIAHKMDVIGGKARRTRVCGKCGQPLERK